MARTRSTTVKKSSNWRFELALLPFVFGAVVLMHWQVFLAQPGDEMHLAGDIVTKDYPARVELLQELRMGNIPAWAPYQFCGWPGLANCEVSPLYLPNLLLLLFWDGERFSFFVFEWFVVLHLILAGWGAARLGKRFGVSSPAAVLTGISFACTGFLLAKRQYVSLIEVMAWYPWAWWALEGLLGRKRLIDFLVFVAVLFVLLAAGHPQMAFYVLIVLAVRAVHAAWRTPVSESDAGEVETENVPDTPGFIPILRRFLPFVAAVVFAFFLSAAMWLPFMAFVPQGERSQTQYSDTAELALQPEELLDLTFPEQMPPVPEISGSLKVSNEWNVEIFYVGLVTLFLAVIALQTFRKRGASEAVLAIAVLGVLLSLGPATRLHDLIYVLMPWMSSIRASSRWMGIVALPLHLAAGRGLDYLRTRKPSDAWPRWLWISGGIWAGVLLFLMLILTAIRISAGEASQEADEFLAALVMAAVFSILFVILLWLRDARRIDNGILCLGIGLLLWFDLTMNVKNSDLRKAPAVLLKMM